MKSAYKILYFIAICMIATSCKKQEDIEIVSLTKLGDEFYFGERVLVYAPTTGDKDGVSYDWEATGGTFIGSRTQDRFENLWQAPSDTGTYYITVRAKKGKTTTSRTTKMRVSKYFFEDFKNSFATAGAGWASSNTVDVTYLGPVSNGIKLTATGSGSATSNPGTPNFRKALEIPLKIPFSVRTTLGWSNFFRTDQPYFIGLLFKQPLANRTSPYIREIRLEIWPQLASGNNYRLRFETFVPSTGTSRFTSGTPTVANPVPLTLTGNSGGNGRRADFLTASDQTKTFSISIDKDNVLTVHVDGVLWITSNGIKDWLTFAKANYPNFEDPEMREYRITWPARPSYLELSGSTILVKSVHINNNDEILK
jgi:hypothetical protein